MKNNRPPRFSVINFSSYRAPSKDRRSSGIFKTKTFISKLFLKLTAGYIEPSISCIQTLKFERVNRSQSDISGALPWLKTMKALWEAVKFYDDKEAANNILNELCWILFYQYNKKYSFIKKSGENGNMFYLVMSGEVIGLIPIYKREYASLSEYLIYLIKLILLKEINIAYNVCKLNRSYFDINPDYIQEYCEKSGKFKFEKLKKKALDIIESYGISIHQNNNLKEVVFSDLDEYVKAVGVVNDIRDKSSEHKLLLYIGKYQEHIKLDKGKFIGNLSQNNLPDEITYVAKENSDIGFIDKREDKGSKLFPLISIKKQKSFDSIFSTFFILREMPPDILLEKLSKNIVIQKKEKDSFLFHQNSLNEGVYFIISGIFDIYIETTIEDIDKITFDMCNALVNFFEIFSQLKEEATKESIGERNNIKNDKHKGDEKVYSSPEYLKEIKGKKKIKIETINTMTVLGLNEFYSNENGLYYFNAKCISEDSLVYFVNKKVFYELMGREPKIANSVKQIVELNAKRYIGTMKNYKKNYMKDLIKKIQNKIQNDTPTYNYNSKIKILDIKKIPNKTNEDECYCPKKPLTFRNKTKLSIITRNYVNLDKNIILKTIDFNKTPQTNNEKSKYPPIFSQSSFSRKILGEYKNNEDNILKDYIFKTKTTFNFENNTIKTNNSINSNDIRSKSSIKDFYIKLNKIHSKKVKTKNKVIGNVYSLNKLYYRIRDKIEDKMINKMNGENEKMKEIYTNLFGYKNKCSISYNKTINNFYKYN